MLLEETLQNSQERGLGGGVGVGAASGGGKTIKMKRRCVHTRKLKMLPIRNVFNALN